MKYPIITHGGHTYRAHMWGVFSKGYPVPIICESRREAREWAGIYREQHRITNKIKRVTVTWKGKV